jgi:hypothetical protein
MNTQLQEGYLRYYITILNKEHKLFIDLLKSFRENNNFERIFYICHEIWNSCYGVILSEDELLIMKLTLNQETIFKTSISYILK